MDGVFREEREENVSHSLILKKWNTFGLCQIKEDINNNEEKHAENA